MIKYLLGICAFCLFFEANQCPAQMQDINNVPSIKKEILANSIEILPSSLDFGTVKPGIVSIKAFKLYNRSISQITITSLFLKTNYRGFEVLDKNLGQITIPFILSANDSVSLKVRFVNVNNGTFHDTISVSDNIQTYDLCNLSAVVSGAIIDVSSQIFQDTYIGSSITKQLTIHNIGTLDLYLQGYQLPDTSVFIVKLPEINPVQTYTIPAGNYYYYNVTFKPKEAKNYIDSIVFTCSASIGSFIAILKGNGINNPDNLIEEKINNEHDFNLFPNPVSENLTIQLNNAGNRTFRILDTYGNLVDEFSNNGSQRLKYNTSKLANGIYFLQMIMRDKRITKSFMVVR